MSKVFAGDMTYVEAARLMALPVPTVWHCFAEHWRIESTEQGVALKPVEQLETIEDFVSRLRILLKRFIQRLEEAMKLSIAAYNETAVTRLSAEMRALMRDILAFEGKLQTAPIVQLNILQVQQTKLTSWLFTELCRMDREKLLASLPELMTSESVRKATENIAGA